MKYRNMSKKRLQMPLYYQIRKMKIIELIIVVNKANTEIVLKCPTNFENCILPCLYYKINLKNMIVNNEEINEFNHRLKDKYSDDIFSKELSYYLKQGNLPINFAIKLWIKYYTSKYTFKETMNLQFNQNNFSNYTSTYIRAKNLFNQFIKTCDIIRD